MSIHWKIFRGVATLTAAAVCTSISGLASAADAASTTEPMLEEVVVTGSRIPVSSNMSSTSPIQVVTREDIALAGHTDAANIINQLPQAVQLGAVDTGNKSSPLSSATGFTTADLRGLGPQRTLVLVDGRRLGNGDSNTGNPNPSPNLDEVPAPLIERVEVVTGGASAVYGSDAIAGVVNFIMKKDFQGIQIDGQYGFSQHNNNNTYVQGIEADSGITDIPKGSTRDGGIHDLSIVMGTDTSDGKGNVTGYFVYHNQAWIPGGKRDYANCQAATVSATDYACFGSSNSNWFEPLEVNGVPGANSGSVYSVVGNQFLTYPQTNSVPPPAFNFTAYQTLQRQDERYMGGVTGHVDINDMFKPYLDFTFMNDTTDTQVGPSALFRNGNVANFDGLNYQINCSNPLLSAQEAAILCSPADIAADAASPGSVNANLQIGRRNVEGGGRRAYNEHTNYRAVAGLKGDLGPAWNYEAYGQVYRTASFTLYTNYLDYSKVTQALQATGTAANPVCINSAGGCIPYNPFKDGGVTAAQEGFLQAPGSTYGTTSQQIAHLDFTGDLGQYKIKSPWATDGLAINLGVEHRYEALTYAPDATAAAGFLSGFSGAVVAIDKGYTVDEAFTEIRAPIAAERPGMYDLTADVGYRYSDYSVSGGISTYKFEVQYAPVQDYRFRYSWDRAIRAPNLIELYNPQSYGQSSGYTTDPCAPTNNGATHAAASLADCLNTHVTAAQYGNGIGVQAGGTNTITQCISGQCGQVIGGNPDLQPETADTYSLGLTFTPAILHGLTGSIDYYNIRLKQAIGTVNPGITLDQCLATGNAAFCDLIVRTAGGALTGSSVASGGYIFQTSTNIATNELAGIDVQLADRWQLGGWGTLTATLSGAWLEKTVTQNDPSSSPYDCAGLFGNTCNGFFPTWRHNLRLSWTTPWKLLVSAQWRYLGATSFDNNSSDPNLQYNEEGAYDPLNAKISAWNYLDLSAMWQALPSVELRAGITNILDKDPPFVPSLDITPNEGNVNTYTGYDTLGRQLFIGFTAKF